MRVTVQVRAGARQRRMGTGPDGTVRVSLPEPAQDGRANTALIAMLAEHFRVPKRAVRISRGLSSRRKVVDIG